MSLKDRIGFDAGKTRLEDAIQWAIDNEFFFLDFNADAGPNHMDTFTPERSREVRKICESNGISIGLHTLSAVNVAEFSPHVSRAVEEYMRASVDLANQLDCAWTVVHAGYHFSDDIPERKKASIERLKRISKYGSDTGQRILLENLNFEPDRAEIHYIAHTVEELREYFDEIPAEYLGWAFTANHSHLVPDGIDGFLNEFGIDRIGEVRLADNAGDYEVHLVPGEGNLNFTNLFTRIENFGYKGHYSMAYGSDKQKIESRDQLSGLVYQQRAKANRKASTVNQVDNIESSTIFPKGATTHGRSTRAPATGKNGMVASAHPYASRAGVDILRDGGNAFDAAVAVAAMLNVAEPYMSGSGGIGIGMVYVAKEGRTRALNFSGHAPNAAQPEMYDHLNAETGPIAPMVPGNVSGWMTMHETYGKLPLSRVMRDAIQYADEGVVLTPFNADMVEENLVRIDRFGTSQKALVIERDGMSAGSLLRQPQLAASLALIAEGGQKEYYEGKLGDRIQAGLAASGGIISREELAAYRAEWQEPLTTNYRGFEVRTPPPNSSAFQILETLNILNNFDELPYGSSDTLHKLVEAVYIAADDRAQYAGDPRVVDIPLDRLLSAEYASEKATGIKMLETSGPPAERWDRSRMDHPPVGVKPEFASGLTTHFATADAEGNVVTITQTLGGAFGSAVTAGDTGIFMNNMSKWFDIDPDSDSPNLIGPGKLQDFCIAPAQVYEGSGEKKIRVSVSTPGSWGILHTTAQMMHHFIDAGMNIQEAIEAPRFRHYDTGMLLLENRFPPHIREDLARRGHQVHVATDWHNAVGGGQGIQFTEHGTMLGGADPRRDGVAMGY